MSIFIDPNQEVPVSDEDGNTIWVLSKMDYKVDAATTAEFGRINRGNPVPSQRPYELALLYHNVKRWDGPFFKDGDDKPVPCTKENIGRLDPDHPLIKATVEKIGELNAAPTEPPPDAKPSKKKAGGKDT